MSLYLKYRPQKFKDLIGQEAIKKTLTNTIKKGRISHAYLFVGPKGTGKTTTARLVAKSLNCLKRKKDEFEPCNNCHNCQEITSGHSLDVLEIDAASNRGIDDIRELRDKIRYAPSGAKYKVYIIDEVHMLTKESFNALLKTLEEPPKHAIFIMATTEPEKVPETILSRVQEFDFMRATVQEIKEDLQRIVKAEKIKIEPEAINLIAEVADGSFRDAESILDQVNSLGEAKITLKSTQEIMGIVADKVTGDFLEFISQNKSQEAIKLIAKIYAEGYNLADFNSRIIEYLRNILLFSSGLNIESTISEGEIKRLKTISINISEEKILAMINRFLETGQEMKSTRIIQLPLELAVYEMVQKSEVRDQRSEIKIPKSELRIKNLEIKNPKSDHSTSSGRPEETRTGEIRNPNPDFQAKWEELLKVLEPKNRSLSLLLKDSELIGIKGGKLTIGVKFKFYAERIENKRNYQLLADTVEQIFGQKYQIDCSINKPTISSQSDQLAVDPLQKNDLVSDTLEIFGK